MWRRVITALVAALVAWMGLVQPGEAVAAAAPHLVAYSYDGHHHSTPLTPNAAERGPPAAYDHDTAAGAVDLRLRGASARPASLWSSVSKTNSMRAYQMRDFIAPWGVVA